jgi:hypothetical protein
MLSFLIYFFVLIIGTASVLFGLDLVTSPLSPQPNVPIGRTVQISPQPPQAQKPQNPQPPSRQQQRPRQQQADRQADERSLTPVYPVSPAPPPVAPAAKEAWMPPPESGATPAPPAVQPSPGAPAPASPSVAQVQQPEPAASAQPTQRQASGACNAEVCAAAHPSFRASDCSYQTYRGVRRACTIPVGAMASARPDAAGKPRGTRRPGSSRPSARSAGYDSDMSEAERVVRQMTRDDETDIPVLTGDGDIIIVRKSYR